MLSLNNNEQNISASCDKGDSTPSTNRFFYQMDPKPRKGSRFPCAAQVKKKLIKTCVFWAFRQTRHIILSQMTQSYSCCGDERLLTLAGVVRVLAALMHHTSGVRDDLRMSSNPGW